MKVNKKDIKPPTRRNKAKPKPKTDQKGMTKAGKADLDKDLSVWNALEMAYRGKSWDEIANKCGFASIRGAKRAVDDALVETYNPHLAIRLQVLGVNRVEVLITDMLSEYNATRSKALDLIAMKPIDDETEKSIDYGYSLLNRASKQRDKIIEAIKSQSEIANVQAFVEALASGGSDTTVNVMNNFTYQGVDKIPGDISTGFRRRSNDEIQLPAPLQRIYDEKKSKKSK